MTTDAMHDKHQSTGIPAPLRWIAAVLCGLAAFGMVGAITYPHWQSFLH